MNQLCVIEHPTSFKTGTRAIMLKGRHKDGIEDERSILRVSHDADEFDKQTNSLLSMARDGERIYASAGPRDMHKAIRIFKERQLDADYAGDPFDFYRHIEARWYSCLMSPFAQAEKFWLFDCDSDADRDAAMREWSDCGRANVEPYSYKSKNGWHIIVHPFDKSRLSVNTRAMLHDNAIILWAY